MEVVDTAEWKLLVRLQRVVHISGWRYFAFTRLDHAAACRRRRPAFLRP